MDDQDDQDGQTLPLADAAAVLGITPEALRKRIARDPDRYVVQRANDGRVLVTVQPEDFGTPARPSRPPADVGWLVVALTSALADRDARVDVLSGRMDDLTAHVADLQRANDDLRAERDRALADAERLRGELERERADRRWPGLVPWLRRVLLGKE